MDTFEKVGKDFENYISFTQFFDYLRSLKKSYISIMRNVNIKNILYQQKMEMENIILN